jgi:hypothetical protein
MHKNYCFYPNEPCCCGESGNSRKEKEFREADRHDKDIIIKKDEIEKKIRSNK